jgi:catechol 2,3-dioxygenase-like lactoylglutathione lyase family enzyme
MKLSGITYLVKDYDEAIRWFVDVLGFVVLEDTALSPEKRWVRVATSSEATCFILARADTDLQVAAISNTAGGRVGYFLQTPDFTKSYGFKLGKGVVFREAPSTEHYGTVAVFEDLYGNGWDLICPASPAPNLNMP